MTFSEIERVLNHCPHLTNFWLFLRVGEFLLFVLLTSMNFFHVLKHLEAFDSSGMAGIFQQFKINFGWIFLGAHDLLS